MFWIAALVRKGGRVHRAAGRRFAQFVYAASATGGVLALAQLIVPSAVRPAMGAAETTLTADALSAIARQHRATMIVALYVLILLVAPVQHGLATLAAGADPRRLRTRAHATLNTLAIVGACVLLPVFVAQQQPLYLVVVPLGFVIGLRNLAYAGRVRPRPAEWEREHLTSMLTAGVVLHTALFVFGTTRTLGWSLAGWAATVPWLVPSIVGFVAIVWFRQAWPPRGPAAPSA